MILLSFYSDQSIYGPQQKVRYAFNSDSGRWDYIFPAFLDSQNFSTDDAARF